MKTMTRQQLAYSAGVTPRTLYNWLAPYREQLLLMAMPEGKGTLPPHIIKWITDHFGIDT